MPSRERCPRCGSAKAWVLADQRRRCAQCRYDWRPARWPLRLPAADWRRLLAWFARGASGAAIAAETGLDRKQVIRALTLVRTAMAATLANVEPAAARSAWEPPPANPGVPVIGIRFRQGQPSAEVIAGVDGRALGMALRRQVPDLRPWEPALAPYTALVVAHRLRYVSPVDPHPPHGFAELGGFWQYLERQLTSRGGIRRDRLGLYLAEYSWRYHWRKHSTAQVVTALAALVHRGARVSATGLWGDVDSSMSATGSSVGSSPRIG